MHIAKRITTAVFVISALISATALAADPPTPPAKPAQVLVVGTFHFANPGHDTYKPQYDINIFDETRQAELQQMIDCLSKFHPTKILVEQPLDWADTLNARYQRYMADDYTLPSNEVYQLGFRLARANGLSRVYPIDADARYYEPYVDPEEYAAAHGQDSALTALDGPWDAYYMALYAYEDEKKTRQPLTQTFLQMNDASRITLGHGHYLIGSFKVGEGDEYPGADSQTGWYNRNLRIFANITRITDGPDDRLLVIIGAGHLPILRQAIEASPQYELLEVSDFLGNACNR